MHRGSIFTIHCRAIRGQNARGQVLVLVAISLTVLLGFAALATDVGLLYVNRRQMQSAADAAAIAGANARLGSQSGSYQSAAKQVASLNGFTDGQNNVTVTIGPPASPPNPTTGQYVEADLTRNVPVYFLSVLGYSTVKISVRAVAGTDNSQNCIYALDSSAPSAISLMGNFSVNSSCGIIDCSSSATALSATGNGTVKATATGVVGNYSASGNVTFTPTPKTGIAPVADPLASQAPPSVPTCSQQPVNNGGSYTVNGNNQNVTVPAGVYPQPGILISGNSNHVTFSGGATYGNGISLNGNLGSVTFNPGNYQSGGSGNAIAIAGNATTTFTSGTYSFCGPVAITGNNTVTLSPGLYYGGINITGNATVSFNPGTYVIAGGGLSVTGNSNLSGQGVTFYLTTGSGGYGPVNLTGNATVNLSAPTSGSLEGILFFQDRSIPNGSAASMVVGNSSSTFDGTLYFPTTGLTYLGNSSVSGYTIIVANTLAV
ncbi:MAG: hypothetical protein JO189_09215, partial [Deltaproteobacteria bacterium]|nr:hypothetical protein [Deltaproteobacteria bacterium]